MAEFNRLAGTDLTWAEYQGVSGGEIMQIMFAGCSSIEPSFRTQRSPTTNSSKSCGGPKASNLISHPLDYDAASNTWKGGRRIGKYDPPLEEIVDRACRSGRRNLAVVETSDARRAKRNVKNHNIEGVGEKICLLSLVP